MCRGELASNLSLLALHGLLLQSLLGGRELALDREEPCFGFCGVLLLVRLVGQPRGRRGDQRFYRRRWPAAGPVPLVRTESLVYVRRAAVPL